MNGSFTEHIPVLAETLADQITLPQDAVMVDTTVGQGGHSYLFGKTLGPEAKIIGLDVDQNSILGAHSKLKDLACKVILVNKNFSHITDVLKKEKIQKVDFILADLGWSSAQVEDSDIGMSFQSNMPLDMRLDKKMKVTAADIVNKYDEKSLADLIFKYGEDRASRRIARFIADYRQNKKIETTGELAAIVSKALWRPGKQGYQKIHPATRTFQALRIAINRELENLESLLEQAPNLLKTTGKIAVISFHSLEDRIVKYNFKDNADKGIYKILTKKPLTADYDEITKNKRARSAKLRIAEKL